MSTGRAEGASEQSLPPLPSSPDDRPAGLLDAWLRCDAADPDAARDGRILAAILSVIVAFAIIAFVLFVSLTSAWLASLPDIVTAVVLSGVFIYNRRGNPKGAAIITVGFTLVAVNSIVFLSAADFTQLNGALLWAPVIVLAGAVLSWRSVLFITAACVVNVGCADYFRSPDVDGDMQAPRLAAMSLILGFVGALTAIIRHQASHYQRQLRVRNHELDRINASLESEVHARTHELVVARDAALAAARVKSAILANVNHELRTPMNAMLGMTELLLDTHLDDSQREQVQTVRDSGGNLLALIDDVLDFSALDAPSITVQEHTFQVRALVQAALESVASAAAKKGLSLVTEIDARVPAQLVGDAGRLRKVLDNLLGNAVRFTASGGITVGLEAEELAGRVRLRAFVRDTGIGISEERVHLLFVPFGQLDASLTRRFGGTGLGLAICRRIVEHMGGHIGVESRPGEGSTFTFEVEVGLAPLAGVELVEAPRSQPAVPIDPSVLPGQYHALRILLAEDNVVNQKVAMSLLKKLGYSADVVANGREAVAAVEDKPYDVVLMDIQMPEMDGLQATRTIAVRLPSERRPRIIALTAHTQAADKEQCLAVGMAEFISKPVQLGVLRDALLRVPVPAPS